jgi:hypothetical protein
MTVEGERPDVTPECRAFRLVRVPDRVKTGPPEVPTSHTFTDHKKRPELREECMSVFLEELFVRENRTPCELLTVFPGHRLCYLTAGQLEDELGQSLFLDPTPEFPGHAVVYDKSGKRSQGTRDRMVDAATWHHCEQDTA